MGECMWMNACGWMHVDKRIWLNECLNVYMCFCRCVDTCWWMNACKGMNAWIYICVFMCMAICVCVCARICAIQCGWMHALMNAWMYLCDYVCIVGWPYVCMCVHMCIFERYPQLKPRVVFACMSPITTDEEKFI